MLEQDDNSGMLPSGIAQYNSTGHMNIAKAGFCPDLQCNRLH